MDELHMLVKKFPQIISVTDVIKVAILSTIVHKVKIVVYQVNSKEQQAFLEVFCIQQLQKHLVQKLIHKVCVLGNHTFWLFFLAFLFFCTDA